MGLGALLRLVLFVGSIREKDKLRRKQRPFTATDLAVATEIDRGAVAVLRGWPRPLREVLRNMLPPEVTDPAALNFSEIFGNFYRHLFRVLPRSEFGFLHDVFERFVIEDWKGLIRGQHRYFSAAVRRNSHWVAANEAERIARTTGGRILDLAHQGQIDAIFLNVRRGGSRTECWIRRESLNQWIAARDAELAPLHAATRGGEGARSEELHPRHSRRRRSHPLRERTRAEFPGAAVSSSFAKTS